MGHVQSIIDQMKQKQAQATTAAPIIPQTLDLPGDHRAANMKAQEILYLKGQYNSCLRWLRMATQRFKRAKKKSDKDKVHSEIAGYRGRMAELLTRIGTYDDEERLHGFKEVQHGN